MKEIVVDVESLLEYRNNMKRLTPLEKIVTLQNEIVALQNRKQDNVMNDQDISATIRVLQQRVVELEEENLNEQRREE